MYYYIYTYIIIQRYYILILKIYINIDSKLFISEYYLSVNKYKIAKMSGN